MTFTSDQEITLWVNTVLSAVRGTAGSICDSPADNAIAIADRVVEGLNERMPGAAGISVPRVVPPKNMRGAG